LPIEDVMAKHRAQHAADAAATQPHRAAQAALPQAGERRKFPQLPGHPGQK
jgi:hypothetical protein